MNLTQSYGSGGSINSAYSTNQSNTAGIQASQTAQAQTAIANSSAQTAWERTAQYNAEQARINREWQERMANTVYQRTVEDMRKSGINPVLAAGMGLGTASVSGGSAASISPSQVFNAQTFPESTSSGESISNGKSWQNSESGLITFANALSTLGQGLISALSSGQTINLAIQGLENLGQGMDDKGISWLDPFAHHDKNGNYKPGAAQGILFQEIGKAIPEIGKKVKTYANEVMTKMKKY